MKVSVNKIFGLLWGQCSEALQAAIKLSSDYTQKSAKFSGVWLLRDCKKRMAGLNDQKNIAYLVREKQIKVLLTRQGDTETLSQYFGQFKANVKSMELLDGKNTMVYESIMGETWEQVNKKSDDLKNVLTTSAKEKYLAMCLLMGANDNFFGVLKKNLHESRNLGLH